MLRLGHRQSKDIDLFVPDPQYLGYVNPRLSDAAEDISTDYEEASAVRQKSSGTILDVREVKRQRASRTAQRVATMDGPSDISLRPRTIVGRSSTRHCCLPRRGGSEFLSAWDAWFQAQFPAPI